MYNEYDGLDELLEEAYLEGYYDGYEDDYDGYYVERKSTLNPAYMPTFDNPNKKVWDSRYTPHKEKIFKKVEDKYKDEHNLHERWRKLGRYNHAYDKLIDNKIDAYIDRRNKDKEYLRGKGVSDPYLLSRSQQPGFKSR